MYSLVHFPEIDTGEIEVIRKKYDPTFSLISPHITLIFLLPDSIDKTILITQIKETLKTFKSFEIRLSGLEKSWDHWLVLKIKEGKEEIIRLHDQLYTGPIVQFLRKDIPFQPHLSLGLFASGNYHLKDPQKLLLNDTLYNQALKEVRKANLDYRTVVHEFTLITLNDTLDRITKKENFRLT